MQELALLLSPLFSADAPYGAVLCGGQHGCTTEELSIANEHVGASTSCNSHTSIAVPCTRAVITTPTLIPFEKLLDAVCFSTSVWRGVGASIERIQVWTLLAAALSILDNCRIAFGVTYYISHASHFMIHNTYHIPHATCYILHRTIGGSTASQLYWHGTTASVKHILAFKSLLSVACSCVG